MPPSLRGSRLPTMSSPFDLDILYSRATDWLYGNLATRLWSDLPDDWRPRARLWDVPDWLAAAPARRVLAVNWAGLVNDPRLSQRDVVVLMSKVNSAAERILLIAECVGTDSFQRQFQGPEWTALVDVGWHPQTLPAALASLPYRFLYHTPTRAERAVLAQVQATAAEQFPLRPIPWAVVGKATAGRAALVAELTDWEPDGVAFLPADEPWQGRPDRGRLSRAQLARLLAKTRFYVWVSRHAHSHFEAFRALEALLSGACPIKLDARPADGPEAPGCVLTDVAVLRRFAATDAPARLITTLCAQLLARPPLGAAFAALW
ncbi:hypothetical protein [Chloracidobacterium aggregatum]|nr:hypothetical protein [Chloracidobacterium aggregatum]QUV98272.1 hypothetical protein J8C00_14875 [Chloracidobacterium sp. E]